MMERKPFAHEWLDWFNRLDRKAQEEVEMALVGANKRFARDATPEQEKQAALQRERSWGHIAGK